MNLCFENSQNVFFLPARQPLRAVRIFIDRVQSKIKIQSAQLMKVRTARNGRYHSRVILSVSEAGRLSDL